MAASLLLPAVLPPLVVAAIGYGWCKFSNTRRMLYFLMPINSFLVVYITVVGVPVNPTKNALSWLFYTGLLLTVYWLVSLSLSLDSFLSWPLKVIVLSVLTGLIYYPRFTTTTKALTEISFAGLVILMGTFYWQAEQARGNEHPPATLVVIGAHLAAGAVFFGIYTSFIVGQVALASGLGFLGAAGVLHWFNISGISRSHRTTVPITFIISTYCLFYTTLQPLAIVLYLLGLSSLWLILRNRFEMELWQSVLVALVLIGLFTTGASVVEEYNLLSGEGSDSYRPYDRRTYSAGSEGYLQ